MAGWYSASACATIRDVAAPTPTAVEARSHSVVITSGDRRSMDALLMAASSQTWKLLDNGRFGIPSQSTRGLVYVATLTLCSCPDFQRRLEPCKHVIAVRIYVAFREASR